MRGHKLAFDVHLMRLSCSHGGLSRVHSRRAVWQDVPTPTASPMRTLLSRLVRMLGQLSVSKASNVLLFMNWIVVQLRFYLSVHSLSDVRLECLHLSWLERHVCVCVILLFG